MFTLIRASLILRAVGGRPADDDEWVSGESSQQTTGRVVYCCRSRVVRRVRTLILRRPYTVRGQEPFRLNGSSNVQIRNFLRLRVFGRFRFQTV